MLFLFGYVQWCQTCLDYMRNMTEHRNCLPFASTWVHPRVLVGSVLLIVLVLCVVLCFVCLRPLSCVLNVDSVSCLSSSFVLCPQCWQCLLFVFVLCLVSSMLTVSLVCLRPLSCVLNVDVSLVCLFLIAPSLTFIQSINFFQHFFY